MIRKRRLIHGTAKVVGALDKNIIRRIVRRHHNGLRFCFRQETAKRRVMTRFTIAPSGKVRKGVKVRSLAAKTPLPTPLRLCLTRTIRRWLFPAPRDGAAVTVRYPFTFERR